MSDSTEAAMAEAHAKAEAHQRQGQGRHIPAAEPSQCREVRAFAAGAAAT